MRIANECVGCLGRQAVDIAESVSTDPDEQGRIIKACLQELAKIDFKETAPEIAYRMHRAAREITGIHDPYKDLKNTYNEVALSLCDQLAEDPGVELLMAERPFDTACRLAIAGNIIDFSVGLTLTAQDVAESIETCLAVKLFGAGSVALERAALAAKSIVYLADNAGEIVFDRFLIEALPRGRVTLVVKGGPIVNDATYEDAVVAGLPALVPVIDNGHDAQGTILSECSPQFLDLLKKADLVISKGQANFETLSDVPNAVENPHQRRFYLLRAKCASVAKALGCEKMAYVLTEV